MLIFDSHCDSATCALSREASLNQRVRGRQFDFASAVGVTDFQVMAIYLDKEPRSAITYADLATPLAKLQAEINANGEVRLVSRAQELSQWQQGPLGVILAVEGGEIIEKAEQLDALYGLGIRSLTLTWNSDNRLAGGNGGSPTLGLTALGRDVLRAMNRLGMVVDIAHLSPAGVRDVLLYSQQPVIASHANCAALCPHSRNLTDEQIKALAAADGVLGVTYVPQFLRADPRQASVQDLLSQIIHVADLVGTAHVGLGSDFDGVIYPLPGLSRVEEVPRLAELLADHGFHQQEIAQIMGGNFLRVFQEVLA